MQRPFRGILLWPEGKGLLPASPRPDNRPPQNHVRRGSSAYRQIGLAAGDVLRLGLAIG